MSFADKKGITVASGFKLQAGALLDAREQVDTIQERNELVSLNAVTEGLKVYVKETQTLYVWNGTDWDELAKGTGYTHPDSGVEAGTYRSVTVDEQGHVTAGTNPTTLQGYGITDAAGEDHTHEQTDIEGLDAALEGKVPTSRKINNKPLSEDVTLAADDVGAIATTSKGSANGVAELDETGKVPSSQLPSYVDDVVEGYLSDDKFYEEEDYTTEINGESGKIYVDLATSKTYRWSGTTFAVISDTITLGETSTTAFRGDFGKAAYDHSQAAHAPSNAQKNVQIDWSETDTSSDAYIKNKPTALPADGGNADTVSWHTVAADVPEDAKFTDTVYTHPDSHPASIITESATKRFVSDTEKETWNNKATVIFASELPSQAPAGAICFLTEQVSE